MPKYRLSSTSGYSSSVFILNRHHLPINPVIPMGFVDRNHRPLALYDATDCPYIIPVGETVNVTSTSSSVEVDCHLQL